MNIINKWQFWLIVAISPISYSETAPIGAQAYKPVQFNAELVESLKEYDRQMYESLPNRIDCEIQTYLENCEHINFMLKKHPDAPMRIPTESGTEVVLRPDTPSSFVDFILSPNQQSAQRTLEYWRNNIKRMSDINDVMLSEIYEQGGISTGRENDPRNNQPRVNEFVAESTGLKLEMIIESSCPACKFQLGILDDIVEQFPNIEIVIIQIDSNLELFQRNVIDQGLNGVVLSQAQADRVLQSIKGWPYTRITNQETDHSISFYGTKIESALIQELAYAAKYKPMVEETL